MVVRLNPAVRVIPPEDPSGDEWVAENLLEQRSYKVSRRAATALVAAGRAQEPRDLVRWLVDFSDNGESDDYWARLIATLCRCGLILDIETIHADPELSLLMRLRREASRSAARYDMDSAAATCSPKPAVRRFSPIRRRSTAPAVPSGDRR